MMVAFPASLSALSFWNEPNQYISVVASSGEGAFSTAIFNSDIELSLFSPLFRVLQQFVRLSLC